jgi:hypothetical protein
LLDQAEEDHMNTRALLIVAVALGIGLLALGGPHGAYSQTGSGWITLVDGKTMGDWDRIGDANWRMEDGALVADKKTAKGQNYLVGKTVYKDLEIYAEFFASSDANSGIFFRCADRTKLGAKFCYEANINDPSKGDGTGAISGYSWLDHTTRAGGRWNTFEISARGPQLSVTMNGKKTAEAKDTTYTEGVIALQYGAGTVKYRKLAVRPLP